MGTFGGGESYGDIWGMWGRLRDVKLMGTSWGRGVILGASWGHLGDMGTLGGEVNPMGTSGGRGGIWGM